MSIPQALSISPKLSLPQLPVRLLVLVYHLGDGAEGFFGRWRALGGAFQVVCLLCSYSAKDVCCFVAQRLRAGALSASDFAQLPLQVLCKCV